LPGLPRNEYIENGSGVAIGRPALADLGGLGLDGRGFPERRGFVFSRLRGVYLRL